MILKVMKESPVCCLGFTVFLSFALKCEISVDVALIKTASKFELNSVNKEILLREDS